MVYFAHVTGLKLVQVEVEPYPRFRARLSPDKNTFFLSKVTGHLVSLQMPHLEIRLRAPLEFAERKPKMMCSFFLFMVDC